MLIRLRNYALVALGIGVFYFFLTHHILFTSFTDFHLLKKTEPTLKFTFLSIRQLNPNKILRFYELRDAGLGEWLVDNGYLHEGRYNRIMNKIEAEEESEN